MCMWVIDKDVVNNKKVEIVPSRFVAGLERPYKFRILGEDSQVLFEGKASERDSKAPMEAVIGAKSIQYYNDLHNEWQ